MVIYGNISFISRPIFSAPFPKCENISLTYNVDYATASMSSAKAGVIFATRTVNIWTDFRIIFFHCIIPKSG